MTESKPGRGQGSILLLACTISLTGFLFGFDAAIISSVGGLAASEFGLDDVQFGLLVTAPSLAAIFAGLVVGPASDLLGRRLILILVGILYAVSAGLSAWAPNFEWLFGARALGGFAFASLVLAPLYIAEIAPTRQRGALVAINQLNIVVGLSIAYFAGYYILLLSQSELGLVQMIGLDTHAWRWMLGVELVPAAILLIALTFAPESPRWLMTRDREEEARKVLARFHPADRIEAEIEEIRASIAQSRARDRSPLSIFLHPSMLGLILVGLIVAVAQQITGINAVFFYAATIFELAGAGANAAFAQAVAVGLVNVAFTVVAIVFIDRLGRKPLLIAGLAGVVISMASTGYGFQQASFELTAEAVEELHEDVLPQLPQDSLVPLVGLRFGSDVDFRKAVEAAAGRELPVGERNEITKRAISINAPLVLAGILGFVASFAFSLGPVMWVLLSELFPNRVRGMAMSLITFVNAGVSASVQFFFPIQIAQLGAGATFFLYGAFGAVFLLLSLRFVPETKGLSLEELEARMRK